MVLVGIRQSDSSLSNKLLLYALRAKPSFVIDCANAANPHALFSEFLSEEPFMHVQVIQVELIYKFRDVLKQLVPNPPKRIVITTFHHLFNYNNEKENAAIYEHAWELMATLGRKSEVIVGVAKKHEELASKYCTLLE